MPPPPPSLGLGLSLVRGGVVGPATPALIPDAVWQIVVPAGETFYNHPETVEDIKLNLPGGYYEVRVVFDQFNSMFEGNFIQGASLYDYDFNESRVVLFDGYLPSDAGELGVAQFSNVSASDLFIEYGTFIGAPASAERFSVDFGIEVLASTVRFGLFYVPFFTVTSEARFRVSLYILSSTPY